MGLLGTVVEAQRAMIQRNENTKIYIVPLILSYHFVLDGESLIEQYLKQKNLSWEDIWYIGNDVNDIGAIRKAKFSICPIDAVKAVKKEVDLKLKTKGGYGVLSELATLLET